MRGLEFCSEKCNSAFLSPHSSVASALALSSLSFQPVESFITFISLQSSYAWYLNLSQFETVFLGFLMLQICFFRYLEILPINLNNWFLGEPSGRKRRRKRWAQNTRKEFDCDTDVFLKSVLKVLHKIDDGNCLSLTLCELESMSSSTINGTLDLSKSTRDILTVLKTSARYRHKALEVETPSNFETKSGNVSSFAMPKPYCPALEGLKTYEDAVLLGLSLIDQNYNNSTICEKQYSACPLTKRDVEHYIGILIKANML